MSVQYRAVWQDDRSDLIDSGRTVFQEWIDYKNIDLEVPFAGIESNDSYEIRVDNVSDDDIQALRISLDESREHNGDEQRWTTVAHWMTNGTNGWIWIDVEWVSNNISNQPLIFAPKLVAMLLDLRDPLTSYPNLGPHPLRVESENDVDDLIEVIFDKDRSIPVIVYSTDQRLNIIQYTKRVEHAARRLAGCADIRMLTKETQDQFNRYMDSISMSVFDGAVRIYLPDIDVYDPKPWKHRYIQSRYLSDDPLKASDPVVRRILPRIIAQRPPEIYATKARRLLAGQNRDWQEFALEQDEIISNLDNQIRELNSKLEDQEIEMEIAYETADESEQENNKLKHIIEKLRKRLRILNENPDVIEQGGEATVSPSCCKEAIELAQGLEYIVIHSEAAQDIDRMDQNERSKLWGKKIYSHLLSLDAYARAKTSGFEGGLIQWFQYPENIHKLSTKFVAMKESEYVRTNTSLMERRYLPIDKSVDPTGRITMEAHLKPIEGGGMQIPRIYFHDDTMGITSKVHIGFIGPHDLMPNKSAN